MPSPRPLPTQKEIARLAGVSQVTVNAVLNGSNHTRTRPETRDRILAIAKQLNYRIQRHARLMKTGKSGSIALVGASHILETTYLRMHLCAKAVRAAGYFPKIYDIHWTEGNLAETWNEMRQDRPEGVLLLGGLALITPELRSLILSSDVPIVSISGPKLDNVPLLIPDYYEGFRQITLHLARAGRRKITLILRNPNTYQSAYQWQDERRPGYLQAMKELDLEPLVYDRTNLYSEQAFEQLPTSISLSQMDHCRDGYDFTQMALDNGRPKNEAWIFFNDALAFGALRGLGEAGISVPQEVALTGSDGETRAQYGYLPITTLVQPLEELVREGVELLTTMIGDNQLRSDLIRRLPCTLRLGVTG